MQTILPISVSAKNFQISACHTYVHVYKCVCRGRDTNLFHSLVGNTQRDLQISHDEWSTEQTAPTGKTHQDSFGTGPRLAFLMFGFIDSYQRSHPDLSSNYTMLTFNISKSDCQC